MRRLDMFVFVDRTVLDGVLAVSVHRERAGVRRPGAGAVEAVLGMIDIGVGISGVQRDRRMPIPAVHRSGRDTRRGLRHGSEATTDIVLSTKGLIGGAGLVFVFHEQTVAFYLVRLQVAAAGEAAGQIRIADAVIDGGLRKWAQRTR